MKDALVNDTWYGQRPPGALLRGLERVYRRGLEHQRRRGLAERCTALEGRPIVVVGNLTVGGAGKSPLVLRLCELAVEAGLTVGVVSRGHGRASKTPIDVTTDTDPAEGGDEPVMIARRGPYRVRVDADREAAAMHLFQDASIDLVIADDGLQRWRLPRELEICVVDGHRGFGNGHLLPAGPLREPLDRLSTVDEVVVNGEGAPLDLGRDSVTMRLEPVRFESMDGTTTMSLEDVARESLESPVRAVAGIGRPERFFETLENLGVRCANRQGFDDHHRFADSDFDPQDGRFLMTEKDAVKCRVLGLRDAWFLRVEPRLPEEWENHIRDKMLKLAAGQQP